MTASALTGHNVVFSGERTVAVPRVTIGMPTYNRADTIGRALQSLARQTYRDFVLIVSDNAGVSPATIDAVRAVADDLPEVHLIAQPTNLGIIGNATFLVERATTEYFMWLADDDEISDDYLAELVALLDADPAAASAMGVPLRSDGEALPRRTRQVRSTRRNRAARVFNWVAFQSEDTMFYGLHRTAMLRRCTFGRYVYPNAAVATNWCYVYLFDQIWQGPVRYSDTATWTAHHDVAKSYNVSKAGGVRNKLKTLTRRINVYAMYNVKTARRAPPLLALTLPASLVGMAWDVMSAAGRVVARRLPSRTSA